jgi:hypothetical protein
VVTETGDFYEDDEPIEDVLAAWERSRKGVSRSHPAWVRLLSADGKPVAVDAPLGRRELSAQGKIDVGRPAGLEHGGDIDAAFVLDVPALPLAPGRYRWRLDIGDDVYTASPGGVSASADGRRPPGVGRLARFLQAGRP